MNGFERALQEYESWLTNPYEDDYLEDYADYQEVEIDRMIEESLLGDDYGE